MNYKRLLRLSVAAASLALLAACATTAPVGPVSAGPQGVGIGATLAGFNTPSSPYRNKAPYNQIYFFDFNMSNVHPEDFASIDAQGAYLASHPSASVLTAGNTDERGSAEYNVVLGHRRAIAVANRLGMSGANRGQIQIVSYGAERPIVPGHDEAAYAQNRNVQLSYKSK